MNLSNYIALIDSFLAGRISASDFESRYLKLFKEEREIPPKQVYEVLNKLFSDVDAFCDDPSLRNHYSIDERELRECANRAFQTLKTLGGGAE